MQKNLWKLLKNGIGMVSKCWYDFGEFIISYIFNCKTILCIEIDREGYIVNHNDYLNLLLHGERIGDKNLLNEFFIIESSIESKLRGLACNKVEMRLRNEESIKLNGYLFESEDGCLYMMEKNMESADKLFEQMDEINLELSNLTREINRKNRGLNQKNHIITEMMYQDPLTKLSNRRYLNEQFRILKNKYEIGEIRSMTLVIMDIDYFKQVNDSFGHDVGDEVLIRFSNLIRQYTRDEDLKVRFGGDEFIVVFLNVEERIIVKRLNLLREEFKVNILDGIAHKLTASFGVAEYLSGQEFDDFVKNADKALYEVKKNGRDGICFGEGIIK